jgi:hypothetical protein
MNVNDIEQNITKPNTTSIIIICILSIVILYYIGTYAWEYVKPYLSNIEGFTQYSSLKPSLSNTVQFDTNYYLRNSNTPVVINNKIGLPVIKYGLTGEGGYEDFVGSYIRKHIYPIKNVQTISSLDTIYKLNSGDIDIAFVNEELLTRFVKRDCKYLSASIKSTLGIDVNLDTSNDLALQKRIYPDIKFSAIGVGFHLDFYLIVSNFSNIVNFLDIKTKHVGVWNDSYYDFVKLCAAYKLNILLPIENDESYKMKTSLEIDLPTLINKFTAGEYDAIFIVCHPKNKHLLELTSNFKVRFIHTQARVEIGARNNLKAILDNQNGSGGGYFNAPKDAPILTATDFNFDINTIHLTGDAKDAMIQNYKTQAALHSNLISNDEKADFNTYIKKIYHYLFPKAVDLNKFYKSGNFYSYLETYSQRMVLVIRNDIPKKNVSYITKNYINNLEKMRDGIDMDNYLFELNNISSEEFIYDELISFDDKIPLNDGARAVYRKEGLIYYDEDLKDKI